jgi:hypothetical protein
VPAGRGVHAHLCDPPDDHPELPELPPQPLPPPLL